MYMYTPYGKKAVVDKDQISILKKSGWTNNPPVEEVEEEIVEEVEEEIVEEEIEKNKTKKPSLKKPASKKVGKVKKG